MSRVLLVDDDPRLLRILSLYLEMEGHEVYCAHGAAAAWELLASAEPFDIAILDVMMPNVDGIELCRQMRSRLGTRALPIVMFSATGSEGEVERARLAGANHMIAKPYRLDGLRDVIEKLVGRDERPVSLTHHWG